MTVSLASLLTAIVTILAIFVVLWTGFRVGGMRAKHNVVAPATTGHPEFDRAYRVQMNTVEQFIVFLPLLWLSNTYFHMFPYITGALGLVWIVGRIIYGIAYVADPSSRSLGFGVTILASLGLLITSLIGIVQAYMALNAV